MPEKIKPIETCWKCKKILIPNKESVKYGTKEWDGHVYKYDCDCVPKNIRVSIG